MSVVKDCPQCGKHNCVSRQPLNFCMWCGYSFKDEKALGKLIIDNTSGQTSLFQAQIYKMPVKWNGGI